MGYCSDKVIPVKSSLFRGIKVCAVFNDLTWRHADIPYDTQKKKPLRALKDHFNLDLSFSKRKTSKTTLKARKIHLSLCTFGFASISPRAYSDLSLYTRGLIRV